MDTKLLELLVCPVTKGALRYDRARQELVSRSARLAYPVRDGIAVLLEDEARPLRDDELEDKPRHDGAPATPAHGAAQAASAYVVLIPARMGSSRLPGKPLADIAGLPMVVRVAQRAGQSRAARCVVATDDARIVAACQQHGVQALLTDAGHASGSDRLAQACELLGLDGDDIVVNLQGDEPLVEPQLLDAVAALLPAHPQASMGTAARPINNQEELHSPHAVKVVCDARGMAQYFSRAPIPWTRDAGEPSEAAAHGFSALRHIGLYSYRAGFLRRLPTLARAPTEQLEQLEQLRVLWHGYRIAVHIAPPAPDLAVDTPQDLERVRALLRAQEAT